MKLAELRAVSAYISSFARLYHIKRVQDSVLKLECTKPDTSKTPKMPNQISENNAPKSAPKNQPQKTPTPTSHSQHLPQKKEIFYVDLSRGDSSVYMATSPIISAKKYVAPFDIVLSRLNGAEILGSEVVGGDRILRIFLAIRHSYKKQELFLQLEFCGKHTNAIILDSHLVVLEALRHISPQKSMRPVKIHHPLPPMPSNPNIDSKDLVDFGGDSDFGDFEATKQMLISKYASKEAKSLQNTRLSILNKLERAKKSLESKRENLQSADELESRARGLNSDASLALAHIATLKPYMREVVLDEIDFASKRKICLPNASSPQEAINQMFRESKKLAKRAKNIHLEINNLESKIDFLARQMDFVKSSQNLDTLKILKPKNKSTKDSQIGLVLFIEGFKLSMGRNKNENKALLENARADDMWLHIRDMPSSHLFIHCGKQAVPDSVLQKAGEILVGMCAKNGGDFFVDYTKRRFVKIGEGANVVYAKQKSIFVRKS
ncbi:NFACT family protein [Helicobacter sp. T3_23-1056]